MKKLIYPLIMALSLVVTAKAATAEETRAANSEDGPFYLMDYDEFHKITKEQKAFYLGKLVVEIPQVTELRAFTKDKIMEASKDETLWSDLDSAVVEHCEKKTADKSCEALKKARVDAFLKGASH